MILWQGANVQMCKVARRQRSPLVVLFWCCCCATAELWLCYVVVLCGCAMALRAICERRHNQLGPLAKADIIGLRVSTGRDAR